MSYKKGSWGIKEQKRRYKQFRRRMPGAMGRIAVNHFKSGFVKGGGTTNDNVGGWQKRKVNRGRQRAILVKTGDLKRSIRILFRKVSRGFMTVKIGTEGIKYAAVHNFGLDVNATQNVREHTRKAHKRRTSKGIRKIKAHDVKGFKRHLNFKMPKREFIGDSRIMDKKMMNMIIRQLKKVFLTGAGA